MVLIARFAPSPTGPLHAGHGLSALVGRAFADARGGRWLLRIEDIDQGRSRDRYRRSILDDLDWLGLRWDGFLLQSTRLQAHRAALDRLRRQGLLYPCFCTRADIAAAVRAPHAGETIAYPGTCRGRAPDAAALATRPHAWRLDLDATGLPMEQEWTDLAAGPRRGRADSAGDPVLARKDTPTSYALAVVLDDAYSGVTTVVRGADLEAGTALQRLLQQLLGCPRPDYLHHPLLADAAGRRLAKRDGAAALRSAGDPRGVRRELLALAGDFLHRTGIDNRRPPAHPGGPPAEGYRRWTISSSF